MSNTKIVKPTNLTNIDILENFEYFLNQSFLGLIADITKDYIGVERPKNRKELLIAFWITIKLRHILSQIFEKQNIRVMLKERVIGLLDSMLYDIVIYYNDIPIIVVDTYFVFSNINRNFHRLLKNAVFNATNINQYNGLEYLPLFIFPEEAPVFLSEDSRVLDKMEEFNILQLAKLYNFSFCPYNTVDITTIMLTTYIDGGANSKKSSLKVKTPKFSQGELFYKQSLKEGYSADQVNMIINRCLKTNTLDFFKMIVSKTASRIKNQENETNKLNLLIV